MRVRILACTQRTLTIWIERTQSCTHEAQRDVFGGTTPTMSVGKLVVLDGVMPHTFGKDALAAFERDYGVQVVQQKYWYPDSDEDDLVLCREFCEKMAQANDNIEKANRLIDLGVSVLLINSVYTFMSIAKNCGLDPTTVSMAFGLSESTTMPNLAVIDSAMPATKLYKQCFAGEFTCVKASDSLQWVAKRFVTS